MPASSPTANARPPQRILVALDGSDSARVALECVACLPLTAADLVVLLSIAEVDPAAARSLRRRQGEDLDVLLRDTWAAERASARRTVDAAALALGPWETPVRQVVRGGPPVEAIARLTEELRADLLAVGPRGRGLLTALVLGSVTHALLGRVACPVLVGRRPVGAPERVLLAVDGSSHGREAMRRLATYPLAAEAHITVATVAPRGSSSAGQTHARAVAEDAAATLLAAGLAAEATSLAGDPGEELVRLAGTIRADLVAVGSRGRSVAQGILLGSVSRHVVGRATCSVLVAPPARPPG